MWKIISIINIYTRDRYRCKVDNRRHSDLYEKQAASGGRR